MYPTPQYAPVYTPVYYHRTVTLLSTYYPFYRSFGGSFNVGDRGFHHPGFNHNLRH